jgi:SAM-dependent methyltransferase
VNGTLAEIWDAQAAEWARWVRTPGHDRTSTQLNVPRLVELLPAPGRATLDLGCGEGRFGRELQRLGHRVVGVDASAAMVALAVESHEALVADSAALPFADGSFDLVTAFMSLQDIDDLASAVRETGRVLERRGRLAFCIPHPLTTAGDFAERLADAPFVVDDYLGAHRVGSVVERDGIRVHFAAQHRPLEAYSRALKDAGLALEKLREVVLPPPLYWNEAATRWARIPMFLHLRAVKLW